jgi:hypothetical protein
MIEVRELVDTELDAVCGGALVEIGNINIGTQIGVAIGGFGGIGGIGIGGNGGNAGNGGDASVGNLLPQLNFKSIV